MPGLKQCKTLFMLTTTKVSEISVNLCIETSKENFCMHRLIQGRYKNRRTATIEHIRQEYTLPTILEQVVLETSLQLWKGLKNDKHFTEEEKEKIYILIHYFWLRQNSELKFELGNSGQASLHFIFSCNLLTELKVITTIKPVTLKIILQKMKNLKVLEIIQKQLKAQLTVIGKYAHNLVKLRLVFMRHWLNGLIEKDLAENLCFQDYPTNTVKNPICSSLQCFSGRCNSEAVMVILQNIRNLKSLSRCGCALDDTDYTFESNECFCARRYNRLVFDSRRFNRQVFPCSLEEIMVDMDGESSDDEVDDVNNVLEDMPALKQLHISCSILPAAIKPDNNIIRLSIDWHRPTNLIQFPVFTSPWPKLRKLSLYFGYEVNVSLDFSVISCNTPNLETLYTRHCKQTAVKKFTPFSKLQKVFLELCDDNETNVLLLCYHSVNLKSIGIVRDFDSYENADDIPAIVHSLLAWPFPNLEVLLIEYLTLADEADILELLNHLPALKRFGELGDYDGDCFYQIKQECKERNWDLQLITDVYDCRDFW